jgi:hypothetical protein
MFNWQNRKRIDFWLLAGMVGLWVYWLFLYRTRLLDLQSIRFYLWLLWRNKLPVFLFCIALTVVFWCFKKKKFGLGVFIFLLSVALGYWAYGPDFPKVPPLDPPKVLWKKLPSSIPVVIIISYNYREELPPLPFLKVQSQLYRRKVQVTEEIAKNLPRQVREALVDLARTAGEDAGVFEKCLNLATKSVESDGETILLPIFAEKRYEHVTGQLCWVFGFAELQKSSEAIWTLKPSFGEWVAVRLRFPQKAWLTYLAIEPEHVLPNLFRITLVIVGYALFLWVLRYVFQRWY